MRNAGKSLSVGKRFLLGVISLAGLISCGNNGDARAFNYEGTEKFNAAFYAEAIYLFNRAIEIDPKLSEAYTNRAMAKCALEEYESALEDWKIYLTLEKEIYIIHKSEYEHAKEMVENMKSDPKSFYYRRADKEWNSNKLNEALADFTKVLELDPEDAEVYIKRGSIKETMGDFPGAVEDYEESIRLRPEYEKDIRRLIDRVKEKW
ncbi:MAG: tetratricopeptide repeat protein [Planctomycetes bacterium]|nr:tetratricopeptide repeat protein [Planctomycetota bacterium]